MGDLLSFLFCSYCYDVIDVKIFKTREKEKIKLSHLQPMLFLMVFFGAGIFSEALSLPALVI